MEHKTISLKNDLFSKAIESADTALALLLWKMKRRGALEGKLTLSIAVELEPDERIDETGNLQQIDRISVRYKAGYSVADKETINGEIRDDSAAVVFPNGRPCLADIGEEQVNIFEE